ncbi:MAG: histidine phosphatase family protein [Planctomycetaceae bacterium]|nr:histidine phosphatase family protein [Planctomycetaceae bacterium]
MTFIRTSDRYITFLTILCVLGSTWACCVFLLSRVSAQTESNTQNHELTWLIVRHADRDGSNDGLTTAGHERAKQLATLAKTLRVSAVYSTDLRRTRDTAQPTADTNQLTVQTYQQPTSEWLNEVRKANPAGVVLIVAHSNTVGVIVSELTGTEPFEIAHDQFDLLYVVKEKNETVTSVQLSYGVSSATKDSKTH